MTVRGLFDEHVERALLLNRRLLEAHIACQVAACVRHPDPFLVDLEARCHHVDDVADRLQRVQLEHEGPVGRGRLHDPDVEGHHDLQVRRACHC